MKIKDTMLFNDTPFVALDFDIMERNIKRIADLAKKSNVKLRPHTKTHKSAYIAHKQIKAGAIGITTATLGEAEVMASAGIHDILIAFPIIGKKKLERFSYLLKRTKLSVAFDYITVAYGINQVGEEQNIKIPVYIDIDTGLHRMGKTPSESVSSILEIAKLPYIKIKGLMSHAGHADNERDEAKIKKIALDEAEKLQETKVALEKKGITIEEISVGATPTARFIDQLPFITEARPGTYVFNDRSVMATGGAKEEDCAVSVLSTIVSFPSKDRFIIDAGSKTLTQDLFSGGGFGHIKGHNNLTISWLSEEHGIVNIQGETDLRVGDIIEIIPNHVCPVVNLTDNIYGFRNNKFERMITVDARGMVK